MAVRAAPSARLLLVDVDLPTRAPRRRRWLGARGSPTTAKQTRGSCRSSPVGVAAVIDGHRRGHALALVDAAAGAVLPRNPRTWLAAVSRWWRHTVRRETGARRAGHGSSSRVLLRGRVVSPPSVSCQELAGNGAEQRGCTTMLPRGRDGDRRPTPYPRADGEQPSTSPSHRLPHGSDATLCPRGRRWTVAAAELDELLSVTGVDGITLDAGAEHALTFEASSLVHALVS